MECWMYFKVSGRELLGEAPWFRSHVCKDLKEASDGCVNIGKEHPGRGNSQCWCV